MRYSSKNPITAEMVIATRHGAKKSLCRGAWGMQSDCQCMGYDSLCALAAMFRPDARDTYDAVYMAQQEVRDSPYSRGFHDGWDGKDSTDSGDEYVAGFRDGEKVKSSFGWRRTKPNDGAYR